MRKILYIFIFSLLSFLSKKQIGFLSNYESDIYSNITSSFNAYKSDDKYIVLDCKKNIFRDIQTLWKIARSVILVVDTENYFVRILPLPNKTKVVFCGHGGGLYKKMAYCAYKSGDRSRVYKSMDSFYRKVSFVVSSTERFSSEIIQNYRIPINHNLPIGIPRTDGLFDIGKHDAHLAKTKILGADDSRKVILYAPTFRRQNRSRMRIMPCELIEDDFPDSGYILLYRSHPTVLPPPLSSRWLDVTHRPLYSILSISDILVTDYSSILFEYAFFGRPIVLLITDEAEYRRNQRDLWVSPSELVGSDCVCRNSREVFQKISSNNLPGSEHIWRRHMGACEGHSAQNLTEFLEMLWGSRFPNFQGASA